MEVVLVTGSGGLVGSETVRFYASRADLVVGIDNDMRADFFGAEASTAWAVAELQAAYERYRHHPADIRDMATLEAIFSEYGADIRLVVHTAAQPSHDWAARDPVTDFTVNANGTLALLEATRRHAPDAVFVFTSTNKVYGDRPNRLPLVELDTRWEVAADHPYAEHGIDEQMSVDASTHSLFGASKLAADVLVQEYGRYFGLATGTFRGGCLTGPAHSGTQLHGFLAYLMKCTVTGEPYTIHGYAGKQVRDNIHAVDVVRAPPPRGPPPPPPHPPRRGGAGGGGPARAPRPPRPPPPGAPGGGPPPPRPPRGAGKAANLPLSLTAPPPHWSSHAATASTVSAGRSAKSRTSRTSLTGWMVSCAATSSGTSSRSGSFLAGISTVVIPAR
jgi:CDP-paratose 2-epimerase